MILDYAGMNAAEIAAWVAIATAAGWTARFIVKGKKLLGLWGDMVAGFLGVYLMALVFSLLGVDLTARLAALMPDTVSLSALWLNVIISAFLGAIVIRAILRPFTGGGGGGHH